MSHPLRAFVAIALPEAVIALLRKVQQRLRSPAMNVRWVRPENIHLTLKFLGDIDRSMVPAMAAKLDESAVSRPAFSLSATGVGVFPNLRQARVLWVGVGGDTERLRALQTALDMALETIGWEREKRPFQAHLTIGRPRQRIDADALRESLDALQDMAPVSFTVDQVRLYQSVLKPTGAEYHVLHTAMLST